MRDVTLVSNDLRTLLPNDFNGNKAESLAEEIESHNEAVVLVDEVLKLFENNPNADFGAPGPFAHAIETFYGMGYEESLEMSLIRRPTTHTVWLANRIVNTGEDNSVRFRKLLVEVSGRLDIEDIVRKVANEFVALH